MTIGILFLSIGCVILGALMACLWVGRFIDKHAPKDRL